MKIQKLFYFFSCICGALASTSAMCEVACLKVIGQNTELFLNPMKEIINQNADFQEIIKTKESFQEFIDRNKSKFYGLVAGNVLTQCLGNNYYDLNAIADSETITIPFTIDNKKYDITVNSSNLFEYIDLPTAFLVVNNRTKVPGDIIKKSDMPRDYFFTNTCSDYHTRFNLSNKAPVNIAGQESFPIYGGKKNEFFLDFPVGKSCRAFPGLVLGDYGGWGGKEKIVAYNNYREGRNALKTFAKTLQNTSCGNQGLAVYQVSIDAMPVEKNGKKGWAIAGGVTGGTMATLGVSYAITGTTSVLGSTAGLITAVGGPVGWIIGGVLAATATTIALLPKDLADIDQVMVMSEPEIIR